MLSDQQQTLLEYLEQQPDLNVPRNQILILLDHLEPPDCLQEMATIAGNLIHIIPYLNKIAPDQFPSNFTTSWIAVSTIIFKQREEITKLIPAFYLPGRQRPKTGYFIDHPLYYALWTTPLNHETQDFFYHLQAHFLSSVIQFKEFEKINKQEGYLDIRRVISNHIRNHLTGHLYTKLHKILPAPPLTTDDFKNSIYDCFHFSLDNKSASVLNDFQRLLEFTLQIRAEKKYNFKLDKNKDSPLITQENTEDPDAEIIKSPSTIIRFPSASELVINKAVERGEAPDEFIEETICWWTSKPIESKAGESYQLYNGKTKVQHRYIATANQMLPHQWERLTQYEVTVLLAISHHLSQGDLHDIIDMSTTKQQELAALLTVMFWLSKPFEKAVTTNILKTENPSGPDHPNAPLLQMLNYRKRWLIPVPKLEKSRIMLREEKPFLRNTRRLLTLPMAGFSIHCIKPWFDYLSKPEQSHPSPRVLFRKSLKKEDYFGDIISKVNAKFNTRLTLHRISNHFRHYLSDEIHDFTEASICLGEYPPTGQQIAIYYAAPKLENLQQSYAAACAKIERAAYEQYEPLGLYNKVKPVLRSAKSIGSQTCLTTQSATLLVSDLRNKITQYRKEKAYKSSSLILFHNAFTIYCLMFLKFLSGYRDVNSPLYAISDFNEKHDLLVISDKDDKYNSKSRIVPLPPIYAEQLREYKSHRKDLTLHLSLINHDLAETLKHENNHIPGFNDSQNILQVPFLFLLDPRTGVEKKITPSSLKKEIAWSYELPSNANRHYLRTRLRELKVPGEIIDAYMGHWEHGQEPFGRFSAFSALSFKKQIEPALSAICKEIGWECIKGISKR